MCRSIAFNFQASFRVQWYHFFPYNLALVNSVYTSACHRMLLNTWSVILSVACSERWPWRWLPTFGPRLLTWLKITTGLFTLPNHTDTVFENAHGPGVLYKRYTSATQGSVFSSPPWRPYETLPIIPRPWPPCPVILLRPRRARTMK